MLVQGSTLPLPEFLLLQWGRAGDGTCVLLSQCFWGSGQHRGWSGDGCTCPQSGQ